MEVIPERGDIWWVALDPTLGPEIRKTRPCIVLSVKVLNERRRTVIVVPLSSSPKASPPILIPISCDGRPAVAVTDQIRAVAKERLRSRLGVVTTEEMAALEDGLKQVMQLG
jgi:mRNA interferase MazF